MELNRRQLIITLIITGVLVLSALTYYLWPTIRDEIAVNEKPPKIDIVGGSKFQGLIGGDLVCRIPGLYAFTDESVSSYQRPNGVVDQQYNLSAGIHFYHAPNALTVKQILDRIVPVEDNKVLILYYPSEGNNANRQFAAYPELEGQIKIENPDNYIVRGDEGFAVLSCKDTKIYDARPETTAGDEFPGSINLMASNWILFAMPQNGTLNNETLPPLETQDRTIKSLWVQKGPDFEFERVENINDFSLNSAPYYMVWAKIENKPKPLVEGIDEGGAVIPGPITGFRLVARDKSVTLIWDPPENAAAAEVKKYHIRFGTHPELGTADEYYVDHEFRVIGDTLLPQNKTIENLENGVTYYAQIRAESANSVGDYSETFSVVITPAVIPEPVVQSPDQDNASDFQIIDGILQPQQYDVSGGIEIIDGILQPLEGVAPGNGSGNDSGGIEITEGIFQPLLVQLVDYPAPTNLTYTVHKEGWINDVNQGYIRLIWNEPVQSPGYYNLRIYPVGATDDPIPVFRRIQWPPTNDAGRKYVDIDFEDLDLRSSTLTFDLRAGYLEHESAAATANFQPSYYDL